jgi:hypothetical protein
MHPLMIIKKKTMEKTETGNLMKFRLFQTRDRLQGILIYSPESFRVYLQIANEPVFEFFSPESSSLCLGNIKRNIAQAKRGALRGKELEDRLISNL